MNLKTRTNNILSYLVCMYNMRPAQLSKVWRHVSAAKPDPIMGITELYNSSTILIRLIYLLVHIKMNMEILIFLIL